MQVKVHAEVVDLGGAHETSNIFYFTLCTADDTPVPKVFPRTYAGKKMAYYTGTINILVAIYNVDDDKIRNVLDIEVLERV